MTKRKSKSQIGSLTPDHGKSGIDMIPLGVGGMRHAVEKLLMKSTTLVEISSQSDVFTRSYEPTKLQESQL
jgi:hypothetical protein